MPANRSGFRFDHPVVITFLIFAVIGFMYLASEVLKPLALAVLLSFALAPLAAFIERRGLPRFLAVVLTVVLALTALAGVGYKVGQQLTTLAQNLDKEDLENNLRSKFGVLKPKEQNALEKLSDVGADIAKTLQRPPELPNAIPVNVVAQPTYTQRLQAAVGPYLEYLGVASFVLILVLFILSSREDLTDRLIRVFGRGRVSLTTKTMEEVGQRISRYLLMFAAVNSTIGLIVGLGLWAIGLKLALLWGVLMALLRFIPYVGPATAFALPLIFSVATAPGWREPLMVIALFGVVEVLANTFFEPVIYGKTTGVTALGLLVAAMFWTWLWGALGLLLSTPLTVCLAVVGKYVPGLGIFATLLGEDPPLEADVRFYQRLLARDVDGASQIIEAELHQRPRAQAFDEILIPTLSRTERDHDRGDIDDREQAFIRRIIADILDDVESTPEVALETLAGAEAERSASAAAELGAAEEVRIVGVAASDTSDALAVRMLEILLAPARYRLTTMDGSGSPLHLAEKVAEVDPHLIVLSYLPPGGFTSARYLVRRLRARFADKSIVVGRWGEMGDTSEVASRLAEVGASSVVFRLADARDQILKQLQPRPEPGADGLVPSSPAAVPAAASG